MLSLRVLFWRVMIYRMAGTLGLRIRRAREAKRLHGQPWTQEYLAERLGVSTRTVGRWEREGIVPRNAIGALEELLNVSLADDVDPEELELRATLQRLCESGLIEAADVDRLMLEYRERRRRAHHNGTAKRAG